jgi:hypothetical protein
MVVENQLASFVKQRFWNTSGRRKYSKHSSNLPDPEWHIFSVRMCVYPISRLSKCGPREAVLPLVLRTSVHLSD